MKPDSYQMVVAEAARRERAAQQRESRRALAFIAPALVIVGMFLLLPVLVNVGISFTRWNKFSGLDEWAGLANYQDLLSVSYFSEALKNTALWVVVAMIAPLLLASGLAFVVSRTRTEGALKAVFFLPKVLAPAAVGAIWYYMYTPGGVINTLAHTATGQTVSTGYLYDAVTVTPAIMLVFIWQSVGITMVLLTLGLAAIPRDPLEAARVDGATSFQLFRLIVVPLLLPTILVITILNVAAGFTTFDLLWVMATDFPGKRTLSLTVHMYFESFSKGNWAEGCAVAVVLGVMVVAVTSGLAALQVHVYKRIG